MRHALLIADRRDSLSVAISAEFTARGGRVTSIASWRDARFSFGTDGGETRTALWLPDAREVLLDDIDLIVYRTSPTMRAGLSVRSRRYAGDEWIAALLPLFSYCRCPIINSPFPADPSGLGCHTTNGGRRAALERALGIEAPTSARLASRIRSVRDEAVYALLANGPAEEKDLAHAALGLELLSVRPAASQCVPFYWIVDRRVVLERSLDLKSGATSVSEFGREAARVAEKYARAAHLSFGTIWLLPAQDGGLNLGGYDLFPPLIHAAGFEDCLAAELCDRYG